MKAGEKERVGALRLVLSELQKAAKEGSDDETASCGASTSAASTPPASSATPAATSSRPRRSPRPELIEGYLPAQMSDDDLDALVDDAIRETGASEQRDMGRVMKQVMGAVDGRADGQRVSAKVRERLGA